MTEATRLKDLQQQIIQFQKHLQTLEESHHQYLQTLTSKQQEFQNLQQIQFQEFKTEMLTLLKSFTDSAHQPAPPNPGSSSHSPNPPPAHHTSLHQSHNSLLGPPSMGSSTGHEPHRNRFVKLDFPRFSTSDPTDWLFTVDHYCRYNNVSDEDKLLLATMHLDRPASRWYQGLDQDGAIPDWPAFKVAIHRRFGPTAYEDPAGLLSKLTQTSTVLDYKNAFEDHSSHVNGLSIEHLKSIFISGLQPRIRRAVIA